MVPATAPCAGVSGGGVREGVGDTAADSLGTEYECTSLRESSQPRQASEAVRHRAAGVPLRVRGCLVIDRLLVPNTVVHEDRVAHGERAGSA
jgi:hypothetical protein